VKALLLAAGFGKRLLPITKNIPKCLVEFNGKPLLYYWIKMLIDAGISDILVNTHYLSKKVEDYIMNSEFRNYITIVYEDKLLGTGGTLLKNKYFFDNDSIILIHADNLSLFNFDEFIKAHENRPLNTEITMMTFKTDIPESCGIVNLDEDGIVTKFYEKSKENHGNLANAALFIIEPTIFDHLQKIKGTEIDFSKDVIPNYLNRINTFENKVYHKDIGTLDNYNKAKDDFNYIFLK
jgi:mannose-1-phosphate guanylyltransferase